MDVRCISGRFRRNDLRSRLAAAPAAAPAAMSAGVIDDQSDEHDQDQCKNVFQDHLFHCRAPFVTVRLKTEPDAIFPVQNVTPSGTA